MFEPGPRSWEQLYDHCNGAESRRAAYERRVAEEKAALEDFEAWTKRGTERLMRDLQALAVQRSTEFHARTGQQLRVQYPSGPAISVPDGGPEIRFLCLGLSEARVHVYSSHIPGGLIHIHLLPSRQSSLVHHQRLLSEPGAFLVRCANDAYELRHLNGDPDGAPGTAMTLDQLLFKAFRMLVSWAESDPTTWAPVS